MRDRVKGWARRRGALAVVGGLMFSEVVTLYLTAVDRAARTRQRTPGLQ